jgi:hypothetical protein
VPGNLAPSLLPVRLLLTICTRQAEIKARFIIKNADDIVKYQFYITSYQKGILWIDLGKIRQAAILKKIAAYL